MKKAAAGGWYASAAGSVLRASFISVWPRCLMAARRHHGHGHAGLAGRRSHCNHHRNRVARRHAGGRNRRVDLIQPGYGIRHESGIGYRGSLAADRNGWRGRKARREYILVASTCSGSPRRRSWSTAGLASLLAIDRSHVGRCRNARLREGAADVDAVSAPVLVGPQPGHVNHHCGSRFGLNRGGVRRIVRVQNGALARAVGIGCEDPGSAATMLADTGCSRRHCRLTLTYDFGIAGDPGG